jgi:ribosomal-protein-alanine N-acetyltransferase
MILIRTMRSSDLAWAADIESRVFARPWSEADFEKDLENERKLLLVALSDCRPIGYAQCVRAADEADIARVCVEEEFRKKGIATQLLTELFRLCEEEGVVKFFLEVRESNAAARALYDRLGFVQTGVRRSYYEEPEEDAILMARLPEKKLPGKRYA